MTNVLVALTGLLVLAAQAVAQERPAYIVAEVEAAMAQPSDWRLVRLGDA
jgi:hypothetical protein